jgi:hypothetical protein
MKVADHLNVVHEKKIGNEETKKMGGLLSDAIKAMNGKVSDNSRAEKVVSVLKKNLNVPKPLKGVVDKYLKQIGSGDERRLRQQLVKFKDEIDTYLTDGGMDEE